MLTYLTRVFFSSTVNIMCSSSCGKDITRWEKDKGGKEGTSGDEEDDSNNLPLTPNTQAHYQQIDEEFDQVLRQEVTLNLICQ